MIEWNIQSRSHTCQSCSKPFSDGESLHTLLFDHKQVYHRQDICESCWKVHLAKPASSVPPFLSHWHGVYAAPAAVALDAIQKDTAESLLRKLVEKSQPEHAGACFILAVMLERKRILRVKAQTRNEGQRILIYEHPKTGEVFTIPDPALQLDQLEAVQKDVAHLLAHGLDAPVPAEAAPPAPPTVTDGVSSELEAQRSESSEEAR
jgi:hypothetical protein